MIENVFDIEDVAREASLSSDPRTTPVFFVFAEFADAFPSVAHVFIWLLLAAIGVLAFAILALQNLYNNNRHYYNSNGFRRFVFNVFSGVKQGGPLSAFIFTMCLDPFIRLLCRHLHGDTTGAFADDIGFVLKDLLTSGPYLVRFYRLLASVANLKLKLPKCVLIPLFTSATRDFFDLRAWVDHHLPSWKGFQIKTSARYLGAVLGPGALDSSWDLPLAKYLDRGRQLHGLGLGLFQTIVLYNSNVVSVLSFVGQFVEPPKRLLAAESYILRLLTNGGVWLVAPADCSQP